MDTVKHSLYAGVIDLVRNWLVALQSRLKLFGKSTSFGVDVKYRLPPRCGRRRLSNLNVLTIVTCIVVIQLVTVASAIAAHVWHSVSMRTLWVLGSLYSPIVDVPTSSSSSILFESIGHLDQLEVE